jgi:hypothetical protein
MQRQHQNRPTPPTPIGSIRPMRPRFAFVHVPKSAGSSIKSAVGARCDPATVSPRQLDQVLFGGFDRFDAMPNQTHEIIAVDGAAALGGCDVVMGHFSVASFSPHFDTTEMMTVLREPRTRLLSLYTFWRGWSPERHADWDPYDASRRAVTASWDEFLNDPSLASQTDNVVARMLLSPHPKIPCDRFISVMDQDEITQAASTLLDQFGFAGVVESGTDLWMGLSEWLESPIEAERSLVTPIPTDTDWTSSITASSAAALSQRTAIDTQLWRHLAHKHNDDVDVLAEATFHRKLVGVAVATPPSEPAGSPELPELIGEANAPIWKRVIDRLRR